jgi:hypothetical protein
MDDNTKSQDFNEILENASEEECAEALLAGLINTGSKTYITRDENGKLMKASIIDEDGYEVFAICSSEYREPKKKEA